MIGAITNFVKTVTHVLILLISPSVLNVEMKFVTGVVFLIHVSSVVFMYAMTVVTQMKMNRTKMKGLTVVAIAEKGVTLLFLYW